MLQTLHVANWGVVKGSHPALHPGRRATILVGEQPVGAFGELHPTVAAAWDLPGRVVLGWLLLEPVLAAQAPLRLYEALPRFPGSVRDVSFVIDQAVPVGNLLAAMRSAGGDLLEELRLFDRYTGEPVPPGKHSLAFSLSYRSLERTLTDAEVDSAHAGVRQALAALGADLRS